MATFGLHYFIESSEIVSTALFSCECLPQWDNCRLGTFTLNGAVVFIFISEHVSSYKPDGWNYIELIGKEFCNGIWGRMAMKHWLGKTIINKIINKTASSNRENPPKTKQFCMQGCYKLEPFAIRSPIGNRAAQIQTTIRLICLLINFSLYSIFAPIWSSWGTLSLPDQ